MSRRVLQLLYDDGGRVSNFRLDSALDQLNNELSTPDRRTLKDQRHAVKKRIKRVLSLGKRYRIKRTLPDTPMEHVIDLSGGTTKPSLSQQFSDTIAAEAPGRAAMARRSLFQKTESKSAVRVNEPTSTVGTPEPKSVVTANEPTSMVGTPEPKSVVTTSEPESEPKSVTKGELAQQFIQRLHDTRNRGSNVNTKSGKANVNAVRSARKRRAKTITRSDKTTTASAKRRRLPPRRAAAAARKAVENLSKELESEEPEPVSQPVNPVRRVTLNFKLGDAVSGQWKGPHHKGEWYPGTVKSIDFDRKTIHIVYTDGDFDKHLSWDRVRVPG